MRIRRLTAATVASLLGAGVLATTAPATAADPGTHRHGSHALGERSLASVLAADGDTFDRDPWDYDIVYQAALTVLEAKPDSAVGVLTDGTVALTAFVPNDRAFRKLAYSLTGRWRWSERAVLSTLAGAVGVDTVESVLLYHVVPGATIDYRTAKRSDGAVLGTALPGASITVDVVRAPWWHRFARVRLVDADPDARDAVVVQRDVNRGNQQIGHGVSRVLRPVDL